MWKSAVVWLVLMSFANFECVVSGQTTPLPPLIRPKERLQIVSKKFQSKFLDEISSYADNTAQVYLNQFLQELRLTVPGDLNANEFEAAQQSMQLKQKILLIKQLLDLKHFANNDLLTIYALRNVNFVEKLQDKFREMQEQSVLEMQQLRWYYLCKQFSEQKQETKTEAHTFSPPYPKSTKLVPINDENVSIVLRQLYPQNRTISLNKIEFARRVYENVKISGAEIIDEYLFSIRKLLQELISERSDSAQNEVKFDKIIKEIDTILNIEDFYEKRQRLYGYLENSLIEDYEQFSSSPDGRDDLAEIFKHLKLKGMDLFVAFLFSNFEFLERLHEEWAALLPSRESAEAYEESSKPLFLVYALYKDFKKDTESVERYDKYIEQVKLLHTQTMNTTESNVHIYDLLYSASQNVGTVTFNMIRAKCEEI